MSVPRNKLRGIFFLGSLISPAIKVTLFHASLERRINNGCASLKSPFQFSNRYRSIGLTTVLLASHMLVKFSERIFVLKPRIILKLLRQKRNQLRRSQDQLYCLSALNAFSINIS
jgi:hypothetical protein